MRYYFEDGILFTHDDAEEDISHICGHQIVRPDDDEIFVNKQIAKEVLSQEHFISEDIDNWTREDEVNFLMCKELINVGYRDVKGKMDNGDRPMGELHYGNARMVVKVGPVTEFIAPVEEIERLCCINQKAIEIIARWPTFDEYFAAWNGVISCDASFLDKTILLREYDSIDQHVSARIVTLDKDRLRLFWLKASERVEALRTIDMFKDRLRWYYFELHMMDRVRAGEKDEWIKERLRNERSIRNLKRRFMR